MTTYISKETIERLVKDIKNIKKNPLHENGIFYEHDDSNILKGYALIIGPKNTPYNFGYYLFSIDFPSDYPYKPPIFNYHTNDGYTRFHPNLYISGKVCVSILNTWKGEQWTSCQTIKSILLSLVSLLHNEPLLNEPGIRKTHRDFKHYNSIIQYKNYEVAILGVLCGAVLPNNFVGFSPIIKKYLSEKRETILSELDKLIDSSQDKQEFKTGVYNMNIKTDYTNLKSKLKIAFDEYL